MDVKEFAESYKIRKFPFNHELMTRVFYTDISASTLVWSENNFLVEFYLFFPNVYVRPHSHPFINLVLFNSGSLSGARASNPRPLTLTDQDHGRICYPLLPGEEHWFTAGPLGATFYNVSSWSNIEEKDSATLKYGGVPLGPIHKKTLDSIVKIS